MTPSQICKACNGAGEVKDPASGKMIRCMNCGGNGRIETAVSKS